MPKIFQTLILSFIISFVVLDATSAKVQETLFSVRDFGAAGDGKVKDTQAIQKAVDEANRAGGGTVYFPPGKYLSGTIFLKDFVTLSLEANAVLLGSTDTTDYPKNIPQFRSYTDTYVSQALIYAENQKEIAITGKGTIDGQGHAFPWKPYGNRPDVIRFVSCKHVNIEGIHLQNSPLWMQHYLNCEFVTIRGIHVYNHSTYNNDMIDIDCCRNVIISDCYGNSDDDALTLKSTADSPTENVTITNCVLGSGCNAIKMGTESNGGFKNISITNCVIDSWYGRKGFYALPRGISGIALEIVDGGTMENVTISNINIKNVHVPLFMRLGNRARPFRKDMAKPGIGTYRNVVISNIIATNVEKFGCPISGLPGHPIENVTLSNIRITFPGGGTAAEAKAEVEEKAEEYPEATMFGVLPAYGFYCRHVKGLRLSNIDLGLENEDFRPAIVCDDVLDFEADGISTGEKAAGSLAMFVLKDVRGALIRGCSPAPGMQAFLSLDGKCERVSVMNNDLSEVKKAFQFGEGVQQEVLFQAANRIKKKSMSVE